MIIRKQGAPKANEAYIRTTYSDVVLVEVDFASKYCEVVCTGGSDNAGPLVVIGATKESLYLNEGFADITAFESWTELEFPEYKGWRVWLAEFSRYSLRLCFVKDI